MLEIHSIRATIINTFKAQGFVHGDSHLRQVDFKPWRIHRLFLLCGSRLQRDGEACSEFGLSFTITQYISSVSPFKLSGP